jgi:hypothetical protein
MSPVVNPATSYRAASQITKPLSHIYVNIIGSGNTLLID